MSCTLHINTASHAYAVEIRHAARAELIDAVCAQVGDRRTFVISDANVAPLHAEHFARTLEARGVSAELLVMAPGEPHKTLETVGALAAACIESGADRHSMIIAFGGGIVGDVAGFVAATLLRGVRWIQIPTTLLAQVDSSVGGKTGVNHAGGKNLLGAFYPPWLVFADTAFFATLPEREVRAGLAEALKHAFIADPGLIDVIRADLSGWQGGEVRDLTALIARAIEVKAAVVEADEFERGRRAILNFGHTLGHALEAAWPDRWRHGEAVALGMAYDIERCAWRGLLGADEARIALQALSECGLAVDWRPLICEPVLDKVARDKKIRGEYVNDVLLDGLGRARVERVALKTWQQEARDMAARS